jgi:hypothetical protein
MEYLSPAVNPLIVTVNCACGVESVFESRIVELFPKAVDGHDISSGLSFSVDVRDAVDQVL